MRAKIKLEGAVFTENQGIYLKMLQNQVYEQPLVSVITPTYNRAEYLKEALASAVKQTYKNIEIIISDNCSTDNTEEIVASFADPRIRYWKQPENMGMFPNQIHAFKMARGKYIASLHDDDVWNEDFLEKLVPPLEENPDLILAFCDQYIIDENSNINDVATQKNTQMYKRDQIRPGIHQPFYEIGVVDKSVPTAASSVIRNEYVDWDAIPSEVGGMWDLYLTYLCCRTGHGAYYSPEKLTRYREHSQTDTMLSGNRDTQAKIRKAKAEIFSYGNFMQDEQLQEFRPYFRKLCLHAHTTLAIGLMRNQEINKARTYLWSALRQQKFNFRTLVAIGISFTPRFLANRLLRVA